MTAFSFIEMKARQEKPRSCGLTVVADRGYGLNQVTDILQTARPYIDWFKFGIGAWRLLEREFILQKITLLTSNQIKTFFAGDASELAYLQGVSQNYFREVAELGGDAVEISSAQVVMPPEAKRVLIQQAKDAGLSVIAEAGRKGKDKRPDQYGGLLAEIEFLKKTAPTWILVQAEGITEDVEEPNFALIENVLRQFGSESLIFQAKDQSIMEAYIQRFGHNLNFDVEITDVLSLELLRRGLRKSALAGLIKEKMDS